MRYRIRFNSPLDDEELLPKDKAYLKQAVRRYKILVVLLLVVLALAFARSDSGIVDALLLCAIGIAALYFSLREGRSWSMRIEEDESVRKIGLRFEILLVVVAMIGGMIFAALLSMRPPAM